MLKRATALRHGIELHAAEVEVFKFRNAFERQQWEASRWRTSSPTAAIERVHEHDRAERRYRSWLEGEWAALAVGWDFT